MRRLLYPCRLFALLLAASPLASVTRAQSTMPAGWQNLPAAEFVSALEATYAQGAPAADHERELVTHALNQFLKAPNFIATADYRVVERMLVFYYTHQEHIPADSRPDPDPWEAIVANRIATEDAIYAGLNYAQVTQMFEPLHTIGCSSPEFGDAVAKWMDVYDWRSLSLYELIDVYDILTDELVDVKKLSIRWTGYLTPPVTGNYLFEQLRQSAGDSVIKMWLGNQLVFDSTQLRDPSGQITTKFRSDPVPLQGGAPVAIRMELVNEAAYLYYGEGTPSAVMLWQAQGVPRAVIPTSALSPPPAYGGPPAAGLWGEYFSNARFGESGGGGLVATHLDPTFELIWTARPVINKHQDKSLAIVDHVRATALAPAYLDSVAGEERDLLLTRVLRYFSESMTISDRALICRRLAERPALLQAPVYSPDQLGYLVASTYMVPNKEHLALCAAYANARPQPRHSIQANPWVGPIAFRLYLEPYSHITWPWLREANWSDAHALWDQQLMLENGECNLAIVYGTAYSASLLGRLGELQQRLGEVLADESVTGDVRVTWLLARAYAEMSNESEVADGFLTEAKLVAESPAYREWVTEEQITRLVVGGRYDEARAELAAAAGAQSFDVAAAGALVDQLEQKQAELTAQQPAVAQASYVAELERRKQAAQKANDAAEVARYQQLIERAVQ